MSTAVSNMYRTKEAYPETKVWRISRFSSQREAVFQLIQGDCREEGPLLSMVSHTAQDHTDGNLQTFIVGWVNRTLINSTALYIDLRVTYTENFKIRLFNVIHQNKLFLELFQWHCELLWHTAAWAGSRHNHQSGQDTHTGMCPPGQTSPTWIAAYALYWTREANALVWTSQVKARCDSPQTVLSGDLEFRLSVRGTRVSIPSAATSNSVTFSNI